MIKVWVYTHSTYNNRRLKDNEWESKQVEVYHTYTDQIVSEKYLLYSISIIGYGRRLENVKPVSIHPSKRVQVQKVFFFYHCVDHRLCKCLKLVTDSYLLKPVVTLI